MPKKRINLTVDGDKWRRLVKYAAQRKISASAAVEAAIDRTLADEEQQRQERLAALEEILAIDLGPMGSWEEMEEDIARAYLDGCPQP